MLLMSSSMRTIFVKRFELVFFRSRPGHTLQISAKIISNKLHRLVKIIQTEEQIGYQRNSESPEAQIYDNENYSVSDGEVDGDDDYFN
ncbi:hypothetical protein GCK72_008380 [Caenorhabditis remanei]|uniref:Uncharacterized protein n=1 Tax=Caenorhabditis remanei TaxID=31234 RepID=A0A6A5H033_CAERE|nr:hypothetical protein GCK72_008380 [Caenorhabditis remanei]KAF1760134.1 hypothetical protein GCK72_008380 [Caenorhabditis remanei]